VTALIVLIVALAFMLGELFISSAHERALRSLGAVAPHDPAYDVMRWVYPGAFIVMALEGVLRGPSPSLALTIGVPVFAASKLLKFWAIRALGNRWSFRVYVLPGAPLVTAGPYRLVRHPNYVAVIGELAGMALMADARIAGPLALIGFGYLLRLRVAAEERALGIR
jgi:methyltransferase